MVFSLLYLPFLLEFERCSTFGFSFMKKLNAIFEFLIFVVNRTDLADEAVSALRATVDFTQTSRKLRKVEVGQKVDDALVEEFVVSNITNLLLQIKGWYF